MPPTVKIAKIANDNKNYANNENWQKNISIHHWKMRNNKCVSIEKVIVKTKGNIYPAQDKTYQYHLRIKKSKTSAQHFRFLLRQNKYKHQQGQKPHQHTITLLIRFKPTKTFLFYDSQYRTTLLGYYGIDTTIVRDYLRHYWICRSLGAKHRGRAFSS